MLLMISDDAGVSVYLALFFCENTTDETKTNITYEHKVAANTKTQ